MIYAAGDLHGCYDKYIKMLKKIRLRETDMLYVLGDAVDRGEDGVGILLDMRKRKNVILLLGNHDYSAYCLLGKLRRPLPPKDFERTRELLELWFRDGGYPTYSVFARLPAREQDELLAYLSKSPLYEELEAGGEKFFLAHTVPAKAEMLRLDKLPPQKLITGKPEYEKEYFSDRYLVTGHTPTGMIDPSCAGRIYQKNRHIAVDCGAAFGYPLGCICLDTFEAFYVK